MPFADVEKAPLRALLRRTLRNDPVADESINKHLQATPEFQLAPSVLFYAAQDHEPDLAPTVLLAVTLGKKIYFPRVRENGLVAVRITSYPADLQPGFAGIGEPRPELSAADDAIVLACIPGLAFNAQGYRLGRGKGYYDRFLRHFTGRKLGICYARQLQEIPIEGHDQRVDMLITEESTVRFS